MLDSGINILSSNNILLSSSINIPANNNILLSSSINIQASNETTTPSSSIKLLNISRFTNYKDTLYNTPQKSLISSIISSNLKFTADLITIADQYEFEAQQVKREQQRRRIQKQNQQEGHKV
jgi:hypothetical protein